MLWLSPGHQPQQNKNTHMEIIQETFYWVGILTLTQLLVLLISLAKWTMFPARLKKILSQRPEGPSKLQAGVDPDDFPWQQKGKSISADFSDHRMAWDMTSSWVQLDTDDCSRELWHPIALHALPQVINQPALPQVLKWSCASSKAIGSTLQHFTVRL